MRTRRVLVPVIIAVSTLGACGSGHSGHASDTTVVGDAAAASDDAAGSVDAAGFDDADVEFAQGMIPHHQQAVEMADMALDPAVGASAAVVDLATRIKDAQTPEIELMTGLLEQWGEPVGMEMDGHDMSGDGMDADDIAALAELTGADFDRRWLELMIEHHEGAIVMANDVTAEGSAPELQSLADEINAAQQSEIDEMKALLAS